MKKRSTLLIVFFLVFIFATQSILSYAGEIEKAKDNKTALQKKLSLIHI